MLTATGLAPLVWLQADSIPGWFSENGFTMLTAEKSVRFFNWQSNVTAEALQNAISVVSLKSWY